MDPTQTCRNTDVDDCDNNSTSRPNNGSSSVTTELSHGPAVVTEWRLDMLTSAKQGTIVFCAALIFMLVVGVFGNTLTLVAIRTTPRLWTKSNTLIAGLAAIDLIISGPFGVFNSTYQLLIYVFSNDPCKYHTIVGAFYPITKLPYFAGTVTLIGIAVDRYVAIVHSLRYDVLVTTRKIRIILGMSWVYALAMASISAFWLIKVDWGSCDYPYSPTMNLVVDLTEHSVLSITMLVLYTRIFIIAIKQQRRIEVETIQPTPREQPTSEESSRIESERKTRKRWMRELRAARMTAALVAAYALFTVPYFVVRGIEATGNLKDYVIMDVTISIAALNISLDWLLYAIVSKEYRRAYKRILTCSGRSTVAAGRETPP